MKGDILMRKILAVMIMLLIPASSWANLVYQTSDGSLGLIEAAVNLSVDLRGIQYAGVGSDSKMATYWDGSEPRIILVKRNEDRTTSGDSALIFSPSDLTAPVNSVASLGGVYGTELIAGSNRGRVIYLAEGTTITELYTSDFTYSNSYTFTISEDIFTPQILSMTVWNYGLYALYGLDYDAGLSVVFGFDGQLKENVSSFKRYVISSDASDLALLANSRIGVARNDGVDVISNNTIRSIVSSDAPVRALCRDNGAGFYYVEQSVSGDVYTNTLKQYSSREEIIILASGYVGEVSKLLFDENNSMLMAILGDSILIYDMRYNSLLAEYDSTQLGGRPVNIALSYVNGDDGKTSSGCNSGMGMIMFLACAGVILKRR